VGERAGRPCRFACALAGWAHAGRDRVRVNTMACTPTLWQPQIGSGAPAQPPGTPAGVGMLDYISSASRKWAGTGLLLIFLAVPVAINTLELQVDGVVTVRTASVRLSGTNRDPVLTFESRDANVVCKVYRCRYSDWRNDVGKMVEVGVDGEGRVAQVSVQGVKRLRPEDLKERRFNGLVGALFLVAAGIGMCFRAWQVNKQRNEEKSKCR